MSGEKFTSVEVVKVEVVWNVKCFIRSLSLLIIWIPVFLSAWSSGTLCIQECSDTWFLMRNKLHH